MGYGVDGELSEKQQQTAQVMGERRIAAQVQQPGLQRLLHGLLQPEAPSPFAKDGRLGGSLSALKIDGGDAQQSIRCGSTAED